MIFEKIRSEHLAHNSYFVGSGLEAAVIDPRRDCDVYLEIADNHNVKITHIFETHRNEDYVIGSLELAERVGAEIYHGGKLDFSYGKAVKEGDTFSIGSLELKILETPGHTDESISITVKDKEISDKVYMVFTGDVLFAGDVGRIDLYGEDEKKRMAETLCDTLLNKILPLGDEVIVCPAHGAGSVCGGRIRPLEFTTIGFEKKTNPAIFKKNKEEFVQYKINEKLEIPPYFRKMEILNKEGPPLLHNLPHLKALSVKELKEYMEKNAQIVDTRVPSAFSGGHIPNTINIWGKDLGAFAGWILNYEDPIIVIDGDIQNLDDIVRDMIRLGYDNIMGYLAKGFYAWYAYGEKIETVDIWTVHDLRINQKEESVFILDVRSDSEWEEGYIEGGHHVYFGHLKDRLDEVPKNKHICVYCDSGFRSSIAISILKRNGYEKVTNILGSMTAWENAGYPTKKEKCHR